jgi:hypothetical protein
MADFATVQDVIDLYRPLSAEEQTRTANLLPVISDALRVEAQKVGRDLDAMITDDLPLANTVKSVTVDIVARVLMTPTTGAPMSQFSESAGGYAVSGTFLNPGGGLFIKDSELKRIGLKIQRYGVLEFYGNDSSSN